MQSEQSTSKTLGEKLTPSQRKEECWRRREQWLEEAIIGNPGDHELWMQYHQFLHGKQTLW